MKTGAIILCGGRSARMGLPKWSLPFGPETMLARVARLVGEACPRRVVVAAAEQELPPLPGVRVVVDRQPDRGPLEGLAVGLRAIGDEAEVVYVTGCDVPLLVPAFVRAMFSQLGEHLAAVPRYQGFRQPLAAVYRTSLLELIERRLADGPSSLTRLFDQVPTCFVDEAELRAVDPELDTLLNLNEPEDYFQALARAGLAVPEGLAATLRARDGRN